jgi:hypothetical protein
VETKIDRITGAVEGSFQECPPDKVDARFYAIGSAENEPKTALTNIP